MKSRLKVIKDDGLCQIFCCFSLSSIPGVDGSPVLFRKHTPHTRNNHSFRQPPNDSDDFSSSTHDQLETKAMEDDTVPSFSITSKNLMDLFNAAECDDD